MKIGPVHKMFGYALLFVLYCAEAGAAMLSSDGGRPTAAVLDLDPHNTGADDTAVVSQYIRNEVVKSMSFRVVEKQKMDWLLREQAFQLTGCTSTDCAVSAGRLLNVRYIVFGAYSTYANYRIITAQIVDVQTGLILASDSETVGNVSRVAESAEYLVKRVIDSAEAVEPAGRTDTPGPRESFLFPSTADEAPAGSAPRASSTWKWLATGLVLAAVFIGVVAAN